MKRRTEVFTATITGRPGRRVTVIDPSPQPIGGFVDVGNLVTSGITGARFGMALTWAILLGTLGMTLYGEMAGRVAAVARRPVFHVIRERASAFVPRWSTWWPSYSCRC